MTFPVIRQMISYYCYSEHSCVHDNMIFFVPNRIVSKYNNKYSFIFYKDCMLFLSRLLLKYPQCLVFYVFWDEHDSRISLHMNTQKWHFIAIFHQFRSYWNDQLSELGDMSPLDYQLLSPWCPLQKNLRKIQKDNQSTGTFKKKTEKYWLFFNISSEINKIYYKAFYPGEKFKSEPCTWEWML